MIGFFASLNLLHLFVCLVCLCCCLLPMIKSMRLEIEHVL